MTRLRAFATSVTILCLAGGLASCREKGDIRIASLEFEGVEQVDEGALASALKTRKGSIFPWGRKRYFDRRDFDDDLKRIEAFYHDRGYPDARVSSIDLKLSDNQDAIDVRVSIVEGEPIIVDDVVYEGFDVLPERPLRRLRRELPIRAEQPLDRQLAATARERAENVFRDNGYPYAQVRLINDPVGGRRERVVLLARPGTLAHFGPVEVNGHASVADDVIRRQLTFEPGEEYSREEMRATQRKLYGMELFQFVNVESTENREEQPAEVPIRITVAESKHRKVNFGVGYGSEEHARARFRWDHVNFFGGARQVGIEGRWSSLDRGVRADFREPFFFARNLSLNLEGQSWNAAEPVYSQNTVGGRIGVRYQASERQFWAVSLIQEYQKSTIDPEALADATIWDDLISLGLDPRNGETRGTVSALALDFGRNTTNNLLNARRGYVLNAHVEQAGGWLWGSYNYLNASVEGRYYVNMRRFVWANRINVGAFDPADDLDANVPFHKRFFLGGASSNRGWGRFEVSPLTESGRPIGGLSMLDGSTEVRFPIAGNFGGVMFFDFGNVWNEGWHFDVNDLRHAVGPGLRYQTPIGPARIDFGYQLNPVDALLVDGEPQKRRWRVHFSIGQAF
jgi:outer membrane protein assembly complex protein YaeT